MKKKNAMTLIELQVASVILVVILVATGVVFYFALCTMRFLQDAYIVHINATAALNALSTDIIPANRWGFFWRPAWGMPNDASLYGTGGPQSGAFPGLIPGVCQISTGTPVSSDVTLYLRQDVGNPATPSNYVNDQKVVYWQQGTELRRNQGTGNGMLTTGPSQGILIADHLVANSLVFDKLEFNQVGVQFDVQGDVIDPLNPSNRYNRITVRTKITLHCAAGIPCEPYPSGGPPYSW